MFLRSRYRLLSPRGFRSLTKEVLFPLLIGISLGFFVGEFSFTHTETHSDTYVQQISLDDYESPDGSIFFLRCVVFVHPEAKRPLSFIMAIRDTYGSQCNQTIFYTNSPEIHKKVTDQKVYLIETWASAFLWRTFSKVLVHLQKEIPAMWTIFLDEQVFLRVPNLRRAVTNFNPRDPIMMGRITNTDGNIFFPFAPKERILIQAGIVMTQKAIKTVGNCTESIWHSTTEKKLLSCAKDNGVEIIDPVDEENMHLFHYQDLKTVIPQAMTKGEHGCCSDHAITFGQQSHKEIRMAHFAAEKWSVFGVSGIVEVNTSYAIDRKLIVRLPTKKPTPKPTPKPRQKREPPKKVDAPKNVTSKKKPGLL